jgi:hypothetical protein
LNRRQNGGGQGMVPTGHTGTCFSLAQGCRSGRRLCGKIRFGDKPSQLSVCYFRDLNKYLLREKLWGHYFLGNARVYPHSLDCYVTGLSQITVKFLRFVTLKNLFGPN